MQIYIKTKYKPAPPPLFSLQKKKRGQITEHYNKMSNLAFLNLKKI